MEGFWFVIGRRCRVRDDHLPMGQAIHVVIDGGAEIFQRAKTIGEVPAFGRDG